MDIVEKLTNLSFGTRLLSKFGKTDKDQFGATNYTDPTSPIMYIIYTAITVFALYLAFKCKKDGKIDIFQIILAFFCGICYIPYRLVYPCK